MEAFGFVFTSVSAKSVSSLRLTSTSEYSGLTSNALPKCSSQFLKLPKSTSLIRGLQCSKTRQHLRKPAATEAVLMEPTDLNESSLLEYARLSEDLNSARTSSCKASSSNPSVLQVSGGCVEENLHSHVTKLKKAEGLRREMVSLHQLRQGGFAENSPVYRQIFVIRSYEVGPDKSTSIREIFSLFQEMSLNHVHLMGVAGDGFGATRAMNRLGLIWVVTKMQVDMERYPVWPEVIEIDSWIALAGKNGMRRDWVMRSYQTGEVLARATSTWCTMNGTTRQLSKLPAEVRSEIEPSFMNNCFAFSQNRGQNEYVAPRISKLDVDVSAQHRSSQLTSTPADLDMNEHVNNLKYINWVLESVPVEFMKTHKLASIVLEYRRECHSTDIVESLTGFKISNINGQDNDSVEETDVKLAMDGSAVRRSCCQYTHLLRTQDAGQHEILRGQTTWRSRNLPILTC